MIDTHSHLHEQTDSLCHKLQTTFTLFTSSSFTSSSGTVAQLLALQPHSKKVMGSIPAWGAVGSGGQVLPRPSVLRWAISRAFLCGVCMFSPCSQGVSSNKNPNRKTCKKEQFTLLSVSVRGGRFTWSPGTEKLPTAPGGSWRRDDPGWVKGRAKIHGDLRPARACVCVCQHSPEKISIN